MYEASASLRNYNKRINAWTNEGDRNKAHYFYNRTTDSKIFLFKSEALLIKYIWFNLVSHHYLVEFINQISNNAELRFSPLFRLFASPWSGNEVKP
jgi:hypothetical protein